jgi:LuxR family maltose regulon positive regulatory protein
MRQTANRSLDPPSVMMLNIARAWLALLRGRDDEALALFRSASEIADGIVTPHTIAIQGRAFVLGSLVRMGKTEAVAKSLAGLPKEERELGDMKVILGMLRLAQGDPEGAMAALASVIDGSASVTWPVWLMEAFVLDSIARDSLGDAEGAAQSLERGLELAEPYGAMLPFLLHPSPRLFERHARRRTSHAALLAQILDALSGKARGTGGENDRMPEPLSESERRILRYLPTNLSVPEIAQQTYLSANTIKTHMRHLYDKLGAHSRREAVERARGFGLLAPAGVR